MFGIDNLKLILKFVIDFQQQVQTALKDKKFTWTDSFGFVDELVQIPGLINNRDQIVAEFKDLSKEELDELLAYLKAEFDLEDDLTEQKVEEYITIALSLLRLFIKEPTAGTQTDDGGDRPTTPPPNP